MKVSIITPAYNAEEWIINTYQSLKNQTHTNWEWLITNDCSSDSTVNILQKLACEDNRVKYFNNIDNSGAAVSRNNSLSHACGDFIAFIDSDDLWLSHKLEKQIKFMLDNSVDFSFTSYELIDENGDTLNQTVDSHDIRFVTYEDMLRKKATLGCSTVMLKKNAFHDITMPLIRTGQDYGLWLKLLKTGKNAYKFNQVLTQYRILPNSISRNKIKKAKRQWQIYREIEKLPLLTSIECFCFYAYRAVFRK